MTKREGGSIAFEPQPQPLQEPQPQPQPQQLQHWSSSVYGASAVVTSNKTRTTGQRRFQGSNRTSTSTNTSAGTASSNAYASNNRVSYASTSTLTSTAMHHAIDEGKEWLDMDGCNPDYDGYKNNIYNNYNSNTNNNGVTSDSNSDSDSDSNSDANSDASYSSSSHILHIPDATGRRSLFARLPTAKAFVISKNSGRQSLERLEVFFTNHGIGIVVGVWFLAANVLAAAHGAHQFTEAGGFVTANDTLRVTLPIARAGGRLVTLNCALVLLTACKHTWTWIRTHVAPVIPVAVLTDHMMPGYHRVVATTVLVSGCVVHTVPQVLNYSTRAIPLETRFRFWTMGNGFATTQLLITGTFLLAIFSVFALTTRKSFRRTTTGFRWFWFVHVGGIATAYPLLLLHGTCRGRPWFACAALLPMLLYLADVALRRRNVRTTVVQSWKTYRDGDASGKGKHQITELVLECPPGFDYTPGQYAELRFLPISSSEWHPFTIASAPNEHEVFVNDSGSGSSSSSGQDYNENEDDASSNNNNTSNNKRRITFYIKNSGRWTGALFHHAHAFDLQKAQTPVTIQIRGPHGAPAMNYFEYKHIVVIGSGVGVTPLLSIWKYLVTKGKQAAAAAAAHSTSSSTSSTATSSSNTMGATGVRYPTPTPTDNSTTPLTPTHLFFKAPDPHCAGSESSRNIDALVRSSGGGTRGTRSESRFVSTCRVLAKILESMTALVAFFVVFVVGETLAIVLVLFGRDYGANALGAALSLLALLVHGTTLAVSAIAVGRGKGKRNSHSNGNGHTHTRYLYFERFRTRARLECAVVVVDALALWFSVACLVLEPQQPQPQQQQPQSTNLHATVAPYAYVGFFSLAIGLHALRIFLTYYLILKPTADDDDCDDDCYTDDDDCYTDDCTGNTTGGTASLSLPSSPPTPAITDGNTDSKLQIYSIEGILINQKFSNMRFAARSLLPAMLAKEGGTGLCPDVFSMKFYGTREKKTPEEPNHDRESLIKHMMGSTGRGLDVASALAKHGAIGNSNSNDNGNGNGNYACTSTTADHNPQQHRYFHHGRPDWNTIFHKALSKAHATNPRGESVGVFFCGSPAIAKDLQEIAARVTAQHRYAVKYLEGTACKCKVVVHSENF
mmetsp:Transcript_26207/g.56166  ORF Transcript_26207/g.56166 Transcript_26207/m.56166 type:complete len:1128 (+) Transcript_26207:122-3505(+)